MRNANVEMKECYSRHHFSLLIEGEAHHFSFLITQFLM